VVGLVIYGLIENPRPLRNILVFSLMGRGVFLVLGIVSWQGAEATPSPHPFSEKYKKQQGYFSLCGNPSVAVPTRPP
jgi:hypothetical protein